MLIGGLIILLLGKLGSVKLYAMHIVLNPVIFVVFFDYVTMVTQ